MTAALKRRKNRFHHESSREVMTPMEYAALKGRDAEAAP